MQFVTLLLTCLAFAETVDDRDSKVATEADAHTAVHTDENVHDLHDALVDVHEDLDSTLDVGLEKPHSKKVGLLKKKTATKNFAKAVRMVLSLHEVMGPLYAKLAAALPDMKAGEAKDHAKALLTHVKALDGYSQKMSMLVANLAAMEHGSKEEKEAAMLQLLNGMQKFSVGIKKHMTALHALKAKHASESDMPVMGSGKLQVILHGMEANLRKELGDPRAKSSDEYGKQVKFDLLMYVLVKKAVDESDALFAAAASAFQKNPTEEVKQAVGTVVKQKMDEIQHKLRTSMKAIETALLTESDKTSSDESSSDVEGSATENLDDSEGSTKEAEETPDATDKDAEEKKAESQHEGDDSDKSDEGAKADLSAIFGKLGAALPSDKTLDDAQITRGDEAKVDAAGQAHLSASVGSKGEMKF